MLQDRMHSTKMAKGEGVVPYLTRLTQISDKLGAVDSKTWETFINGVVAREKLPDWQILWDDFVQEETRMGQGSGLSSSAPQIVDEEALALTGKSKGKEKKKKGGKKNLDMSKVKCFIYHNQGHFVSQCPDRKKKNNSQRTGSAEVEEFNKSFAKDFCLIAWHGRFCRGGRIQQNLRGGFLFDSLHGKLHRQQHLVT